MAQSVAAGEWRDGMSDEAKPYMSGEEYDAHLEACSGDHDDDRIRATIEALDDTRASAEKAEAEVERLRREYDVREVIWRCQRHDAVVLYESYRRGRVRVACSGCSDEENARLRAALTSIARCLGGFCPRAPSTEEITAAVQEMGTALRRQIAGAGAKVERLREALNALLRFAPSIDPSHTVLDYDRVAEYERAEGERKAWEAARAALEETK